MNTKQVIVIRKDLKMRRGKEIAQGSHASMAFIAKRLKPIFQSPRYIYDKNNNIVKVLVSKDLELSYTELEWLNNSFTKICCKVNSEQELDEIYEKAKNAGLEVNLITDNGLTEFNGVPTKTCLAIGPDESDKIDKVTRCLELY